MRKLLRYLKHYKKESIIGPLFKLLEACFELIVPLVMANIIDIGIKNQDMPYIWKMGAVLVLFGSTWTCLLFDGTVLCGKGSSRVWNRITP